MKQTFVIHKGWHFSFPRRPKLWKPRNVNALTFEYDFSDASYFIPELTDQEDWNKVCGIATEIFPNKNSVMLGHRYNPYTDTHQACIYINRPDGSHYVDPDSIVTGTTGKCTLFIDNISGSAGGWITRDGKEGKMTKVNFFRDLPFLYRIQPYFGGNQKAPTKVKYHLTFP